MLVNEKTSKGVRTLGLRSVENITSAEGKRRHQRLFTPLGEVVLDPRQLKCWLDDLSQIPGFTKSDVYNYLVLTMKEKKDS